MGETKEHEEGRLKSSPQPSAGQAAIPKSSRQLLASAPRDGSDLFLFWNG
jgi:hypothetical protein